jgi:hypothetical protein
MPPAVTVLVLALVATGALWGMRAGWRHRGERTAAVVPVLPPVPPPGDPSLGTPTTPALDATYVSSTVAGDWLDRVVAHDLGVRSRAVVQVFAGGVRIERPGATDVFVPAGALRGARTTPGMAGKYVGGEGLVVLTWQPPGADGALDTGLRLRRAQDRTVLLDAARALAAAHPTSSASTEETA